MLGCIMFVSCSKEDLSSNEQRQIASFMIQNIDLEGFLGDFYSENFAIGEHIVIDSLGYRITEVIVGDADLARGYAVQEESSGSFLFFFDVDRVNFVTTSFDIINGTNEEVSNIQNQPMYASTNGYDVIGFLGGEYEDPTEWSGRPFIGYGYSYGPCDPIFNRQTVHRQHYFFWIKNGPSEPLPFRPC